MLRRVLVLSAIVLAPLFSLLLHVALNSPISPLPLLLPPPLSSSAFKSNNLLQGVERVGVGRVEGPEDVYVDGEGTIYTATRDGWIKRLHGRNGSSWESEEWKLVGGPALLGITPSADGRLLVCDADKGLLKVGEDGVTVVASQLDDGSQIRFADDAIEASDGTVYFSDASTKFGLHDWFLDVLEARPHGRLLKYDPSTKTTSVLLDDLAFANGVALSPSQDFLIVCESWRFRCLKHWLKGELRGKTQVFIENLPGGPDNINLAPDGSFWIALFQLRTASVDLIHRSAIAKTVIATFPKLVDAIKPMTKGAMVINVGIDGSIRRTLDDSNGRVMSFVTSAMEFEGHLYLGSLATDFIGRLRL